MILERIAKLFPSRVITNETDEPYLTRYCIFGWMPGKPRDRRGWSLYLHHFHTPDADRELHNHPWKWAVSLILRGGYSEAVQAKDKRFTLWRELAPGSVNLLRAETFHRIASLHGDTWTLFLCGPKTGSWGFYVRGRGFVPWRDRLRERGITPEF